MGTRKDRAAWSPGASTSLGDLHELLLGLPIAVPTTRRSDGRLASRPRVTQARAPRPELGFVNARGQDEVDDVAVDRAG
jgi:hypothetical protein